MSNLNSIARAPMPIYGQDHSNDPEDVRRLWALTPTQRVEAMWAGLLTGSQLNLWSRKRPDEVPLLGNEFAFIVMRTPEWAEEPTVREHVKDNVIHLPQPREETDRAAA